MALRDRIQALERRAAGASAVHIVFVVGGLPDDERCPPESEWDRGLDETQSDFQARIHRLAEERGRTGVIVVGGGLPNSDHELAEGEDFDGMPA